jgi:transcriptional regulator, merR
MSNVLGDYIYRRRCELGLSQREFAKKCGVSHTYINYIEKGWIGQSSKVNPTMNIYSKIASALGISETDLVNLKLGQCGQAGATDEEVKYALFGSSTVPDKLLYEVKQYAQYIKARWEQSGP